MSNQICSQCGFMHPPIPVGEKCPMAKVKDSSGNVVNFDRFFTSLKNILTSQIEKKNLKDTDKFLGKVILEITKYTEGYKE